jgi:outer membrane protein OmpA-like peptidoglycan-associated protein/uncharacterized protein YegL/WD40 repeat protein
MSITKISLIFIFLFCFLDNLTFSQGASSGNGLFIASVFNENNSNFISIHKFNTKDYVKKLEFDVKNALEIDSLIFNYNGNLICAKQGTSYFVWNLLVGEQVSKIYSAQQVILANNEDLYFILKNNIITKYDATTGTELMKYTTPYNQIIEEIRISPKDDFIAGIAGLEKSYIWEIDTKEMQEQLNCFDLAFSEDGEFATIIRESEELLKTIVYELPEWNVSKSTSSEKLLETFPVGGLGQNKVTTYKSSISKGGKYVAIYTEKSLEVSIYVFNAYTGKYVLTLNNAANLANSLYPQHWTSETTMITEGANMMAGEYDMLTGTTTAMALKLDQLTGETELSVENQKKNLKYSPDMKYVALQGESNFFIRASNVQANKITFEDAEFLCFTPDNKYLFIKKDNTVNVIVLSEVNKSMLSNTQINIYQFDKDISTITAESVILNDGILPSGYEYLNIEAIQNIELSTEENLRILLKSINIVDNNVELKINLVDENGKAYTGADVETWLYIWCNLILQSPKGTVTQVNNFVVDETIDDKLPTAVALVLDHSGSMGATRINALQAGASKLLKSKNTKDAFMLIKYDNNVKIEVPFSLVTSAFATALANTGATGYGGGTALVDATYLAIKKISKLKNYDNKTIILFTDGYENASIHTKSEIIEEAVKNNVEVNVVGFGEEVNEEYLKSIAYSTGGGFYHLYETDDLKNIFTDIDYKRRNYYSIKFDTQVKGNHIALLQLCQNDEKHDSILIAFNTDYQKDDYDLWAPIPPIKMKDFKKDEFTKLIIPLDIFLKPVVSKEINKEFDGIDFPNILFETNSAKIIESEEKGINEIVAFMTKYPKIFLEINGHTDNEGDATWNLELSKLRTEAAKNLIVAAGIKESRLKTNGYGQTIPIATNDTEEGKALNRRIEFKILEK